MKKNESKLDRIIRFILGVVCLYLGYAVFNTGLLSGLFYVLGVLLVVTSLIGYCAIYSVLGINTNKESNLKENQKANQ